MNKVRVLLNFFSTILLISLSPWVLASTQFPTQIPLNHSGLLSNSIYSKLEKTDDKNVLIYRYIDPNFDQSAYQRLIINPVKSYPAPIATDDIPLNTIYTLEQRFRELITDSFSQIFELTDTSGADVMEIEMNMTAIQKNHNVPVIQKNLLIPTGLLISGNNKEKLTHSENVQLYLETKVTDSSSGKVLGAEVRYLSRTNLINLRDNILYKEELRLMNENFGLAHGLDLIFNH